MAFQTVFKRYELKYMLTTEQKQIIMQAMKPYMELDQYGRTVIRNLYFDTDNYRLVRRSIEKPVYKEKLRMRSYNKATAQSDVFVELKKKYESIVYKRRLSLGEESAMGWLLGEIPCEQENQISAEIDYFCDFYQTLAPKVFLSYEREAFYSLCGDDFRVTFDDTVLCRQNDLSLCSDVYGTPLLPEGAVLMEIKCHGGIPMWMTRVLTEERIYKTSFSKYGEAYRTIIVPQLKSADANNAKGVLVYA